MPCNRKITILAIAACTLALVYALTLFFSPERINARSALFAWLPPNARDQADRIEIQRAGTTLALVLRGGKWFALGAEEEAGGGPEFPVKQGRVDDLFRILGSRGAFPRRGSSAASHEALGLTPETASRLVIRGGAGVPLLDLLTGGDDPSGKEVFLRKNGEDEFRSGDRLIASYVNGERSSWYDLRLFEEVSLETVQRVRIQWSLPAQEERAAVNESYALLRSGEGWNLEGGAAIADREKAETWIRGILEAQGDDFSPARNINGTGKISLELGDGSTLALQTGEAEEDGRVPAMVSGKPYVFLLPQWTASRLLRERTFFE